MFESLALKNLFRLADLVLLVIMAALQVVVFSVIKKHKVLLAIKGSTTT